MPAFLTYQDLARIFAMHEQAVRRAMPGWEALGFPAPLPWSHRQKRWDPEAVRRWKSRQELRAGAHGASDLRVAS